MQLANQAKISEVLSLPWPTVRLGVIAESNLTWVSVFVLPWNFSALGAPRGTNHQNLDISMVYQFGQCV